MNKLSIENLNYEKVKIEVVDITDGVSLKFKGEIDMREPDRVLDPFFEAIHTSALKHCIKIIEMDFRELVFLNSSGIKCLITWLIKLKELDQKIRYNVKIIYSEEITWQSTSLRTLAILVPDIVTAEKG